jgi:ribose transport system ATP-binding protein
MMNQETTLFEVRGITKQYPGTLALDKVDFEVRPGEVHALVGENGAGKSTLMLVMAGVLEPNQGEIFLDNRPITLHNPQQAQQLGISLVFQELALSPNMSVAENVFTNMQPVDPLGLIRFDEMHQATRQALQAFGVEIDPQAPLHKYSLAVQQIVEIARAIQRQTRVLLLDEPTSAIGGQEIERLYNVIRSLCQQGVGIVYVSHKLDEVFAIADRITVLKDGKLVGTVLAKETTQDEIVRMMVGRKFDDLYPPRNGAAGHPLLQVKNLSGPGFSNVTLTAYAGEIVGLFGLTGAGRTELARAIFGTEPVTAGEIYVDGKLVKITNPRQAMKVGIAYVTEDRKIDGLFLKMSIKENVGVTNLEAVSDGLFLNNSKLKSLARRLTQQLQIKSAGVEQQVAYLSGGNQQKVLFGKWLARRPRIFFVDEPTRGVDVGAKADIHLLLRDLAQEGAAVVMISSELPEILGLSDRVAVMRAGQLVDEFDIEDTTEEGLVALAAGVTAAD